MSRQATLDLFSGGDEWRIVGVIEFWVDGTPRPKGSWRAMHNKANPKRPLMIRDSKTSKPWANAVAAAAREEMGGRPPVACPCRVFVASLFPRPKAHYYTKGKAPDLSRLHPRATVAPMTCNTYPDTDKLLRNVLDAMSGIVYVDDGYTIDGPSSKRFVPYGQPGGQYIRVEFLEPGPAHDMTRKAAV